MTYKQMTKEIEAIKEQIEFLYGIRSKIFKGRRDKEILIGDIVNNLCAYQNYLKFSKDYKEKWLADMEAIQLREEIEKTKKETIHAHWYYDPFCNAWCSNCNHIGALPQEEVSPYCRNCGAKMDGGKK